MSDKELKASIPSMSNEQLIELLRSCGRDPYYADFLGAVYCRNYETIGDKGISVYKSCNNRG